MSTPKQLWNKPGRQLIRILSLQTLIGDMGPITELLECKFSGLSVNTKMGRR